jgi:ribosomal protein S18 acetylase RimI-like enzyme
MTSSAAEEVRIEVNPADIDLGALSDLLASRGMRARRAEEMQRALGQSTDVVAAFAGGMLVGFGRMISDGVYYGSIWDVAVKVEHEHRGIGTRLVAELIECARRRGLYMIGLFTASHNRAFYERLGLVYLDDVHAMIATVAQGTNHT